VVEFCSAVLMKPTYEVIGWGVGYGDEKCSFCRKRASVCYIRSSSHTYRSACPTCRDKKVIRDKVAETVGKTFEPYSITIMVD
jgi:hypothetical protein